MFCYRRVPPQWVPTITESWFLLSSYIWPDCLLPDSPTCTRRTRQGLLWLPSDPHKPVKSPETAISQVSLEQGYASVPSGPWLATLNCRSCLGLSLLWAGAFLWVRSQALGFWWLPTSGCPVTCKSSYSLTACLLSLPDIRAALAPLTLQALTLGLWHMLLAPTFCLDN